MIITDRKKPISPLKLIHTFNYTEVNRLCDIHVGHLDIIQTLDYNIGERMHDIRAGLYKIIVDNIEYVIDIYFDLNNGDYFIFKSLYDIKIYMAGGVPYNIIPYRINDKIGISSSRTIETINDNIDTIVITGNTKFNGDPSLQNPASIDRIASVNISSSLNSESDSLNIPFKYTLGLLPLSGAKDCMIINTEQLIAHTIINTSKEILSGALDWQYIKNSSTKDYYVFFAKYPNVKLNNTKYSIRCSHFESESWTTLFDVNTKKNCIATSCFTAYGNGIWIKISSDILSNEADKDLAKEMKKWITEQATSDNPIYIEYQITDTIYDTILIDEYHIKTWYPNTNISIDNDNGFSIFYKSFK